jgi:hypothetical protein
MDCGSVRFLAGAALWLAAAACAPAAAPATPATVLASAAERGDGAAHVVHGRPAAAAEAAAAHRRVLGESPRRLHVGGGAPRGGVPHGADVREAAAGERRGSPVRMRAVPHSSVEPRIRVAAHALRARALPFFHSTAPPPSA